MPVNTGQFAWTPADPAADTERCRRGAGQIEPMNSAAQSPLHLEDRRP
jgi:hypothetical protein